MEKDAKQQALEWLYKQLKKKRTAQACAEQRHKTQAENGHCLECELRGIQKNIGVIEWLIDRAMAYDETRAGGATLRGSMMRIPTSVLIVSMSTIIRTCSPTWGNTARSAIGG